MKIKNHDLDSPGFIDREKKRLEVIKTYKVWEASASLEDKVAYMDALVDHLSDWVEAPEEVAGLSFNALMELSKKVSDLRAGPDPKGSESTENG